MRRGNVQATTDQATNPELDELHDALARQRAQAPVPLDDVKAVSRGNRKARRRAAALERRHG